MDRFSEVGRLERRWLTVSVGEHNIVALTEALPERGLLKGQVGTVVEDLAPNVYEVEFSDNQGRTYAMVALRAERLLVWRYEPALAV